MQVVFGDLIFTTEMKFLLLQREQSTERKVTLGTSIRGTVLVSVPV